MGNVPADEGPVLTGAGVKASSSAFPTTHHIQRNVSMLSHEPTAPMNIDRTAANADISDCFNTSIFRCAIPQVRKACDANDPGNQTVKELRPAVNTATQFPRDVLA
jgi:hypothetical protein